MRVDVCLFNVDLATDFNHQNLNIIDVDIVTVHTHTHDSDVLNRLKCNRYSLCKYFCSTLQDIYHIGFLTSKYKSELKPFYTYCIK